MKNSSVMIQDFEHICSLDFVEWDKFRNKSIFVTGSTGLIGLNFIKGVLYASQKKNLNIKLFALVRDMTKAKEIFSDEINDENLIFVQGDVRDLPTLGFQIDYIVHCASVTTSKFMVSNPVETLLITIEGTNNVLRLAEKMQIKGMVYLSSMEMYGYTEAEYNPITEEKLGYVNVLNVRSCYPEGKRAAECLCHAYAKEYGVPVSIARLAQTFGVGVSYEDNRVFASFAKSAMKHDPIVLHTKGLSTGNYCYTSDVVGALLCLLTKGEHGEAYNVANEANTMRIREMAELVAREVADGKSQVVYDIPEDIQQFGYAPDTNMRLSAKKIRELGWNSDVDLLEMYRRMIRSWED